MGLVGIALPAGFFLLLSIWLGVLHLIRPRGAVLPMRDMIIILIGVGLSLPMLAAMIRVRRRFRGLPAAARWSIVVGVTTALLAIAVVFFALVK